MTIGIKGHGRMGARMLAIAQGEHTPVRGDLKVWFASMDSVAKLLLEHDWRLLELIVRERPRSLTELAAMAGRSPSHLSRTLKTMSRYGLVKLQHGERDTLVPGVSDHHVRLDVSLTGAASEGASAGP